MVITDLLERNAKLYPDEVALVELNPQNQPDPNLTWREFSLIEAAPGGRYRREMTWREFDVKANRFANLLLTRGVKKGDKVAILLMNCLEWLPVYFGVLKTGALAVPMNYRYSAEEIKYCAELADASVLIFGPEFTDRVRSVFMDLPLIKNYFFVGEPVPEFADSYDRLVTYCSSTAPAVEFDEDDFGAIYFSSGTTGFPKAILHKHRSLISSCQVEQHHHGHGGKPRTLRRLIPPLSRDDLICAVFATHNDGLQDTVETHGISKLVQIVLIEVFARLVWIWHDLVYGHFAQGGGVLISGLLSHFHSRFPQKRSKATPEASLSSHARQPPWQALRTPRHPCCAGHRD